MALYGSRLCMEMMTLPLGPHGPSVDIKATLLYYLVTRLGENYTPLLITIEVEN